MEALDCRSRLGLWRKNIPALYDSFIEYDRFINAPLSIDWLGQSNSPWPLVVAGLACGPDDSDKEHGQIVVCLVSLPEASAVSSLALDLDYEPLAPIAGGRIQLPDQGGAADRVRSMPQMGHLVAIKSCGLGLHIWSIQGLIPSSSGDSDEEEPEEGGSEEGGSDGSAPEEPPLSPDPVQMELDNSDEDEQPAHQAIATVSLDDPCPEERGLAWSPTQEGDILSTSQGGVICLYRLGGGEQDRQQQPGILKALHVFNGHSGRQVTDVDWANGNLNPGLFGSVGEDGSVCLWDIRISGLRPVTAWRAHSKGGTALPATGLSFSPLEESQLVTCGGDGKVKVWDVRSTGERPSAPEAALKVLPSHRNPVTQVSWCPLKTGMLASCDDRGLVFVWDTKQPGSDSAPLPKRPELRMIHAGHARAVNDIRWNPFKASGASGMLASASSHLLDENGGNYEESEIQAHVVQLWRPTL